MEGRYAGVSASYCRQVCGSERCAECPAPRILPDNVPAVDAYAATCTQWRYAGMAGVLVGMDYAGCAPVWSALLQEWRDADVPEARDLSLPQLQSEVQVIEHEILRISRDNAAGGQS